MSSVLLMLLIFGARSRRHSRRAHVCVINMRMALASTVKGTLSVSEYYDKMKKLADEMESAGKKLDPEEFMAYVLAGLDMEYNSVMPVIVACVEPITPSELLSQMLSHVLCLEILQGGHGHQPSANAPMSGRCGQGDRGGCGRGRGDGGRGRGSGPN
jgi:hypothetical protein